METSKNKRIVKILFSNDNDIQGLLRFSVIGSIDWPEKELKSKGILPSHEINAECTAELAKLQPLPKVNESDLDICTLNTLLTTTKSVLLLSCGLVYKPQSKLTGSLIQYNPPATKLGGAAPKSRLAKIVSQSHDTRKDEAAKVSPSSEMIDLTLDPNAWLQVLPQQVIRLELDDVSLAYKTCTETNNPSPKDLVTSLVPQHLLLESNLIDKVSLKNLLSKIWVSPQTLKEELRKPDRDNNTLLRQIQIQSLLRLQLLAMDRDMFANVYEKKLLGRKKRRKLVTSIFETLMCEIVTILESASFLLDVTNTTLHEFFSDIFPASIYCSIPDLMQELFDSFECPNPFIQAEDKHVKETFTDEVEERKQKQTKKPLAPPQKKGPSPKKVRAVHFHHNDLITQSVNLTATKRPNPLVKNGKATYIGSHFSTKLANIGAHYHEVPSFRTKLQKNTVTPNNKDISTKQNPRQAIQVCAQTRDQRKGNNHLIALNAQFGKKRSSCHQFSPPKNAVVGETPIKGNRANEKENEICGSLFPSPKRRKFDFPSKSLDFNPHTPDKLKTFSRSSSNARLMALQACNASRRLR
mmetsp:Transcript_5863/g.8516  ORF Transcript_5863/g.8516 Transcript_5863/m.8516 type:complete len:581 (+) Transcript_5863:70-1812(+)|eukprot:CAMPEP_0194214318 /NCGR_PEP_ID=MMETSP0156-20130528/15487_1 /TAXON_ID=33649 /ORGANISM="Thalassionema nitzschioides, Strain L26-B" /LENGTH=580 /DNA_ID=CAMNT_0038942549 /DNA_START=64 /DNA_END=1806 /DNA_ORIENTATION=-